MHDVIVIGAGPAGSQTAWLLKKANLDVKVLEARDRVGLPVQCSGLISKNIDRFVKVPDSCIENNVKGAVVHGPDGMDIELLKSSTAAYVLDRERLDSFLAERVGDAIQLATRAKDLFSAR